MPRGVYDRSKSKPRKVKVNMADFGMGYRIGMKTAKFFEEKNEILDVDSFVAGIHQGLKDDPEIH